MDGKVTVTTPFFRDILIYSFRYALNRRSMAGSIFTDWMSDNIDVVSISDARLMINEIYEAIEDNMAGDPRIDVPNWERFQKKLYKVIEDA